MFGNRRNELVETVTNWKKSPNLTRSSSTRSPSLRGSNNQNTIEYPTSLSPPVNNQLFRSHSTRSSRKLPFFRGSKHGIFNINHHSDKNNKQNNIPEDKEMKPVYLNPKSDAIVMNRTKATINYSNDALSPHLSPLQKENTPPLFFSPQMRYKKVVEENAALKEQEMEVRRNRRRSKSFSGYTSVMNRNMNQAYYEPPPIQPPLPEEPPVPPKIPLTPKRSKSLTRGRNPSRNQSNSTLNSARRAVQKVQQNQANKQQKSPSISDISKKASASSLGQCLEGDHPQVITGQTTLKRTQSLKASLQRWGVEHKQSQSQLSTTAPTTPSSPAIPPVPPLPQLQNSPLLSSNDDMKLNSHPKMIDHSMTNWAHTPENTNKLNLSRQNSLSQKSVSSKNSFNSKTGRKINGKFSNELLVSSLNDKLAVNDSKDKMGLSRSSSLKNSITENSTLIRKHSYRMSIYSDLDDHSSDSSDNSFINDPIKEEDVEDIIVNEKLSTPFNGDSDRRDDGEAAYDKSYKIVEDNQTLILPKQSPRQSPNPVRQSPNISKPSPSLSNKSPNLSKLYRDKRRPTAENYDFKQKIEPEEDTYVNEVSNKEDNHYPEDSLYPEDNREDSRYPEDSRYQEDSRYPEDSREDSRYPEDSRYSDKNDDKDDYDRKKRDTVSTYPEDDGVEEVVYNTIKTLRSTTSSVSVSKEFPDITVLSNSDVGYDDISSIATPTLSTVNQSSIMAAQTNKGSNKHEVELSTLEEASYEDRAEDESNHLKVENDKNNYSDIESNVSSPICNPESILMSEKFNEHENYIHIPPINDESNLKMKRSNSLTKVRKNILMRPRELFPRSASLKTLKRQESMDNNELAEKSFVEKEKRSVTESLDKLLVQLEKIKDDKSDNDFNNDYDNQLPFNEGNSFNDLNDITKSDISILRSNTDKQRLIISNLERKTPEPVWGGKGGERGRFKIEKNVVDTNSIHIETEEATLTEYTESGYTAEPEVIQRKESPVSIKELTPKSSMERIIVKNDSDVKSIQSMSSNAQHSTSSRSNNLIKPKSVISEREKRGSKGSLSPSLLSSSAWQYFNSNKKDDHCVIQPSQTPTSLGINNTIYKSPNLIHRNRSSNNNRIIPPMSTIPVADAAAAVRSPSINDRSSLRKVDSIDTDIIKPPTMDIKPPSIDTTVRSNSVNSNGAKEKIKKLGKLVRNASLSSHSRNASPKSNTPSKALYIISPSLPVSKSETPESTSPIQKDEKVRYRRRVPPEKEDKTKDNTKKPELKKEESNEKLSEAGTEVSSHSLLPNFSFNNDTPLSIEICNALVQDNISNTNKNNDATIDLYNALNNKNSKVISPSSHRYRSHRRSMPRPRTSSRKNMFNKTEEVREESEAESNATEKQSIVLVSSSGIQKFNVVKQTSRNSLTTKQVNDSVPSKENAGENNIGMENGLKLENGRLEVTVNGKDQEMSELAEKLLEGGENKNFQYFDQASYIITPEKRKKKGEFLKNSLKIFKRKSNHSKTPLISSPELISFSNNNGNIETYPLKPMKLSSVCSDDQSTIQTASVQSTSLPRHNTQQHQKSIHLTPILRKTSVNNNTFLNYSPTATNATNTTIIVENGDSSEVKLTKKKTLKIGRFFGKK